MIENNIATHSDSENSIPEGDAFSFANMHYKLSPENLLQTLDSEMHLQLNEKSNFYKPPNIKPVIQKSDIHFSFFKAPITNIVPHSQTTLFKVFNAIKGNYYQERTAALRAFTDSKKARQYKAQHFDYCTFSGVFSSRNDKALIQHSGLIAIDFDHLPNLAEIRNALLADEYFDTQLLFISPSGDGLKWIIPIDTSKASHSEYFAAVANYIRQTYNVEVDKSGRDLSRACFLPYDPTVFINPLMLK